MEIAEKHGLRGEDALKFTNEQIDRAERVRTRQEEKEEKERERKERERERKHETEVENLDWIEQREKECKQIRKLHSHRSAIKGGQSKLPALVDEKVGTHVDSYMNRFERMARAHVWPETEWAVNLSALLTGRVLEVYSRLNEEDANDYSQLKEALLHRY